MHDIANVEIGLGTLINESGKLRMLSHRASMFLAMYVSNSDEDSHLNAAINAVERFEKIVAILRDGEKSLGVERELCLRLANSPAVKEAIQSASEFLKQIKPLLRSGKTVETHALHACVSYVANELLAKINALNEAIRDFLTEVVSTRRLQEERSRAVFAESIQNKISKINSKIKIVSINALIEAKRAGEHGASFGIVAEEISRLSEMSTRVLDDLASEYRKEK